MPTYLVRALPVATGLLMLGFMSLATLALGGDTAVTPHDQLDIEVASYALSASHFASGDDVYLEILGGLPSSNVSLASPGTLVFYLLFPTQLAFSLNWVFCLIVAYAGMYLLLKSLGVGRAVSTATSLAFSLLPFYSVFGLTAMGVPWFAYACLSAWNNGSPASLLKSAVCAALYGLFSSLVLCGYAVLIVGGIAIMLSALSPALRKASLRMALPWGVLIIVYLAGNWELAMSILAGAGAESHRSEISLSAEAFSLSEVWAFFKEGQYHAASNHKFLIPLIAFALGVGGIRVLASVRGEGASELLKSDDFNLLRISLILLSLAVAIAFFYIVFKTVPVIGFRESLSGSLKSFQFDRFYFLYPAVWYVAAGVSAEFLTRSVKCLGQNRALGVLAACIIAVPLALTIRASAAENDMVENVGRACGLESVWTQSSFTWNEFYAEDIFALIEQDVDPEKDGYRVISVGLHPSVALHNGFYCLDGYSTNYPLDYKHEFYEIIEGELACDNELRSYYSKWGNRCYAFSHELGKSYLWGKDSGLAIGDLRLNVEKFEEMGGRYIFCSVPILNEQSYGLKEIGAYDTDASHYRIWVYEVDR